MFFILSGSCTCRNSDSRVELHCALLYYCVGLKRFTSSLRLGKSKMNFDQLLSAIGGFGRYQKLLYVWICIPQIFLAFHMMASVFTGATPPHHCRGSRPGDSPSNGGNVSNVNLSISLLTGHSDSCTVISVENQSAHSSCTTGWVYSHEVFESTTVTEVILIGLYTIQITCLLAFCCC